MTEATYSQARRAMIHLGQKLAADFNSAAGNPVSAMKVEASGRLGFYVHVSLSRPLDTAEKALIPNSHMTVPVRHDFAKPR